MTAGTRITPPSALACAMVLVGGPLVLKGIYDWMGQHSDVAAQPFQRDRVMIYLAALLVAGGAAVFALMGERGPALAVLATAVVPVLVILPGSYTQSTAIYPCLITLMVGATMALRTMLLPGTAVALVSVLTFVVIAVAGGYLLRGLFDAILPIDEDVRARSRLVCGSAGLALVSAPLLWLFTGHRWLAALSAPFLLVAAVALMDRDDLLGPLLYVITGPMAMSAAIYALLTDQ
ncbi:hypothetical protein [Actinomadura sp. 7K507]|uniref:hypothetical protein n=1 Tax=Actinomadura sp. 7K507 TaxID=2530365 RepID=UPI0010446554|nr:hypothetical protein [Actinomadura sp. 7K507]TDC89145.1 hypothetical protein E1285_17015 [Actinomadura sp. 7K507]